MYTTMQRDFWFLGSLVVDAEDCRRGVVEEESSVLRRVISRQVRNVIGLAHQTGLVYGIVIYVIGCKLCE